MGVIEAAVPRSPRIVGIGGSMRRAPASRMALEAALELAREAGAETVLVDVRALDLPLFDEDRSLADYPESLGRLLATVRAADVFLLCTPTSLGTVSGAIKNALDTLSLLADDDPPYVGGKTCRRGGGRRGEFGERDRGCAAGGAGARRAGGADSRDGAAPGAGWRPHQNRRRRDPEAGAAHDWRTGRHRRQAAMSGVHTVVSPEVRLRTRSRSGRPRARRARDDVVTGRATRSDDCALTAAERRRSWPRLSGAATRG